MKIADLIMMLRRRLNDVSKINWPDDADMLAVLDQGSIAISDALLKQRSPRAVKKITVVVAGTNIPDDFLAFVGQAPVSADAGKFFYGDATGSVTLAYFARLPLPSSIADDADLPYSTEQAHAITEQAAVYAANRLGLGVQQDQALSAALTSETASARAGDMFQAQRGQ